MNKISLPFGKTKERTKKKEEKVKTAKEKGKHPLGREKKVEAHRGRDGMLVMIKVFNEFRSVLSFFPTLSLCQAFGLLISTSHSHQSTKNAPHFHITSSERGWLEKKIPIRSEKLGY